MAVEAAAIVPMAVPGGRKDLARRRAPADQRVRTAGTGPVAAREPDFVPVHSYTGWDVLDLPHRYALVYPVSGALAETGSTRAGPDGLARLIGPNHGRWSRLALKSAATAKSAVY
jgi:hypothetical protein